MRGVLAFAPHGSPTYTPLGLATLTSYIQAAAPDCELIPLDLNLALWNHQADADPDVGACRAFMRGHAGDFFDLAQYHGHKPALRKVAAHQQRLEKACRHYLETDELTPELRAALALAAGVITREQPQWIGFSVMFPEQVLFTCALALYLSTEVYAGDCPPLVVGGATASALYAAELLRACPFLTAVYTGEGEMGLARLLRGDPPATIPGLVFRRGDTIVTNRKPDTLSASALPMPRFTELDPLRYPNPLPVIPVVYSRGCKWRRCRFCAHNLSYSGYRNHAAETFADYLADLQLRWGAHHFYFADQYVDAEDLEQISTAILARDLHLSFHLMGRPTAAYTPDRLALMAQAGCSWISWGVETGSARLLDVCGKGTTPQEIRQVITNAAQAGIYNLLMMIFGLPTSTPEDLRATLDLVADLADATHNVTTSRFQLFAKTPFSVRAERYGLRITGQEVLFKRTAQDVHSLRLFHQEQATDGTWRPPSGNLEITEWDKLRRWIGLDSSLDALYAEHLFLYTTQRTTRLPRSA